MNVLKGPDKAPPATLMSPFGFSGASKCITVGTKAAQLGLICSAGTAGRYRFMRRGFEKCLCGGIITCQIWPQPQHCAPCVFNHNVLLQAYFTVTSSITEVFPEPFCCEGTVTNVFKEGTNGTAIRFCLSNRAFLQEIPPQSHARYKQEFRHEPSAHQRGE